MRLLQAAKKSLGQNFLIDKNIINKKFVMRSIYQVKNGGYDERSTYRNDKSNS